MHPDAERTALLLDDADGSVRFVVRRRRFRDRLRARVRAGALDQQLAHGAAPDDGRARALRADLLVRPEAREQLARHWEDLLGLARRPRTGPGPWVPLPRARILAAEDEIRELAAALRASRPVPARGVAMATVLLGDGTGPVYRRGRDATDLRATVREAVRHLDAATALLASR